MHPVVSVFEEKIVNIPSTQLLLTRCYLFIHIRLRVSTIKPITSNLPVLVVYLIRVYLPIFFVIIFPLYSEVEHCHSEMRTQIECV